MNETLRTLVAAELAEPVDPRVGAMAAAVAGLYPGAARAVLFYGSCLRQRELEGLMLDFYLIVSDYRAAYGRRWLAPANRLIPPNVFPFEHDGLVAKYAVLSEADFERLNGPETLSVSVWARFAQPSRLVWSSDAAAAARAVAAVARAAPTLLGEARPLWDGGDPLDLWRSAFTLTYSAELRAERQGRSASVVEAEPERYRRFTGPALDAAGGAPSGGGGTEGVSAFHRARARRGRDRPDRGGRSEGAPAGAAAVGGAAAGGEGSDGAPAPESERHLCRRDRFPRLEDQPPCRDEDRGEA